MAAGLGTHPTLKGSSRALSTVASLIEGTGSIGAAAGPSIASAIGIAWIFYMLVAAEVMALLVRFSKKLYENYDLTKECFSAFDPYSHKRTQRSSKVSKRKKKLHQKKEKVLQKLVLMFAFDYQR